MKKLARSHGSFFVVHGFPASAATLRSLYSLWIMSTLAYHRLDSARRRR